MLLNILSFLLIRKMDQEVKQVGFDVGILAAPMHSEVVG